MMANDKERIMIEILGCRQELNDAHMELDIVNDPDLIDSCIFKIKSLECKHSALLKQYKAAV